jgi:hypothetical protein
VVDVASHARHDRFAIAAALGSGAVPATVRTCPSCGALHRDLLSIQVAIRHAWTPRLPRDLRLRRGDTSAGHQTAWQRLLGAFGSARDRITRPLSIGLTSLGIAGLVLANLTVGFGASAASGFGFGAGGASLAASPEIGDPASAPYLATQVDGSGNGATPGPDPLVIVSGASLVVGGTMLGLRHMAARRRAVR